MRRIVNIPVRKSVHMKVDYGFYKQIEDIRKGFREKHGIDMPTTKLTALIEPRLKNMKRRRGIL